MDNVQTLKDKVLSGGDITFDEALSLLDVSDKVSLYEAAEAITREKCGDDFDSCSIINVKSGRCPENCKWCAQSAHYSTGCDTYDLISPAKCLEVARFNAAKKIKRLSLVASGRSVKGDTLDRICGILKDIKEQTGISTCASLGLLGEEELRLLWNSGVRRYHCNIETAPSRFPDLCTTHTIDDKIATIRIAKKIGFEVCSGGIIGMGETPRQRVEFAWKLKEVGPRSIPINILCPIPGTPLADIAPLEEDDILVTIAIFRFIHPSVQLRFAGGRAHLSRQAQLRAVRIGINGGIVGDLLTTVGSKIDEDRELVAEAGLRF